MKRVLLHICCGPCALYPFETLKGDDLSIEGYFYNPNIQPVDEYERRKLAAQRFQELAAIPVHFGAYDETRYRENTKGASTKQERCKECFTLRLSEVHRYAVEHGFDFFTTTLLVSPYQDQALIKEIGETIAAHSSVRFLYHDFRPGFRQGQAKAREENFYRQKYCGCLASLKESTDERAKKTPVSCAKK